MVAVFRERQIAESQTVRADANESAPIVVIGAGPAGVRVTQELMRRMPDHPIVWYGAENCQPYNRVQLSSLLEGDFDAGKARIDYTLPPNAWLDRRFGCRVASIDRSARTVTDERGRTQRYRQLILATGSSPRLPNIPNIKLPGVYTFRSVADAQALHERIDHSKRTIVIGGGLLGLEAAKAMHRGNTQVTIIECSSRLMMRQLDDAAALLLKQRIEALGIRVHLNTQVREIRGELVVSGVELMNGEVLDCDTIVVAIGVVPNTQLAKSAGLRVENGIVIDDETKTSDAHVYAIGECAEHRGVVYGLAAPGIEQASVAAGVIAGETVTYDGTVTATHLKVVGIPVFSIGTVLTDEVALNTHAWDFRSKNGCYARLVTVDGKLIGATAVGDVDVMRLQDAVTSKRAIRLWQLWNFMRTGRITLKTNVDVAQWSETAVVCNCMNVTRGQVSRAIDAGCASVESLAERTGASSVCGSCKPFLLQMTAATATPIAKDAKALTWSTATAAVLAMILFLPWTIPYSHSVTHSYDIVWRSDVWKQISGYTLLTVSALATLLSLRKRLPKFNAGTFSTWRIAHVIVATIAMLALLLHTGGRFGSRLDFALVASFLCVIVVGAYASWTIAREHRVGVNGVALRRRLVWMHLLATWPLPILLAFHIVQAYYF